MDKKLQALEREHAEIVEIESREMNVARPKSMTHVLQQVGLSIALAYDPQPMEKPVLARDFHRLSALERTAETLRYRWLKLLYALSPHGTLQAWWRLCLLCCLVAVPVLMATICILWPLMLAMELLQRILVSAAISLATVVAIVTLFTLFCMMLKAMLQTDRRHHPHR